MMRRDELVFGMPVLALVSIGPMAGCIDSSDGADEILGDTELAGTAGPSIDAVVTRDGFTEIRQGEQVELVISGRRLGGATSVHVGEVAATIISARQRLIRASVTIPHGAVPGGRAVSVVGPAGTGEKPDAVAVTFYVVSPTGGTGAHGTNQSPFQLCDPNVETATTGDTVAFAAGEHVCGRVVRLEPGVTATGEGAQNTTVRGDGAFGGGFVIQAIGTSPLDPVSTVRNMRLTEGASLSHRDFGGHVAVENVAIVGTSGIRFDEGDDLPSVTIDGFVFDGAGSGVGITYVSTEIFGHLVEISNSRLSNCARGLFANAGDIRISETTIDGCERGLEVGELPDESPGNDLRITVSESRFVDNVVGIRIQDGSTSVIDTTFDDDETTPRASRSAIDVDGHGSVRTLRTAIAGHDGPGIEATFFVDRSGSVTVQETSIVGGPTGISFVAPGDDFPSLSVRNSVIRDQTAASIRIRGGSQEIDLGTVSSPGGNQLSVASGVALDIDVDSFVDIDAHGTTLNGNSYDGQVFESPADRAPDFRYVNDDPITVLRF